MLFNQANKLFNITSILNTVFSLATKSLSVQYFAEYCMLFQPKPTDFRTKLCIGVGWSPRATPSRYQESEFLKCSVSLFPCERGNYDSALLERYFTDPIRL